MPQSAGQGCVPVHLFDDPGDAAWSCHGGFFPHVWPVCRRGQPSSGAPLAQRGAAGGDAAPVLGFPPGRLRSSPRVGYDLLRPGSAWSGAAGGPGFRPGLTHCLFLGGPCGLDIPILLPEARTGVFAALPALCGTCGSSGGPSGLHGGGLGLLPGGSAPAPPVPAPAHPGRLLGWPGFALRAAYRRFAALPVVWDVRERCGAVGPARGARRGYFSPGLSPAGARAGPSWRHPGMALFRPRGAYRRLPASRWFQGTSGSPAGPPGLHRGAGSAFPRGSPLPIAQRRSFLGACWVPPGISLFCSQTPPTSWPGSSTPCCAMARSAWMPARNTTKVSISSGRCAPPSAGRRNWATNWRQCPAPGTAPRTHLPTRQPPPKPPREDVGWWEFLEVDLLDLIGPHALGDAAGLGPDRERVVFEPDGGRPVPVDRWRRASCCPLRPGFTPGLAFCPPAGAGGLLRSPPVPRIRDRSSRWRW